MSTEATYVLKWPYADGTNFIQVLTTALQANLAMNIPFLFWWFFISIQWSLFLLIVAQTQLLEK